MKRFFLWLWPFKKCRALSAYDLSDVIYKITPTETPFIAKVRAPRTWKRWAPQEEHLLLDLHQLVGIECIPFVAHHTGHTPAAVMRKLSYLGHSTRGATKVLRS